MPAAASASCNASDLLSANTQDMGKRDVSQAYRPLAERVRPRTLDQVQGQQHLLGTDKPLSNMLSSGQMYSMVLWGPPGVGKTTLVRIIAQIVDAHFLQLSAVNSGVKEIRAAINTAEVNRQHGRITVLFVDEVHRFNKAQQDGFLPYIENGTLVFIGATTENPAFELNNALLSRLRVHVLQPLGDEHIAAIIDGALAHVQKENNRPPLVLGEHARQTLIDYACGDARSVLNLLESVLTLHEDKNASAKRGPITATQVKAIAQHSGLRFDNKGDLYYDQISALHKSIRGSNPDASLYWLSRMLQGGMSPSYIARRLLRIASEDVGNADPRALSLCLHAWDAYQRLGTPEGELALAHAAAYLACCPKSNAVYTAFKRAWQDAKQHNAAAVPVHLRNAPTRLAKSLGHGVTYRYSHDEADAYSAGQKYFPEEMGERHYYEPREYGLEVHIKERLAKFATLDKNAQDKKR